MALSLPLSMNSGQLLTTPPAQSAPYRRKQYQSCDACRKNRRACDAVSRGANPLHVSSQSTPDFRCSACEKAGRQCTFDWLRGLPESTLPQGLKRKRPSLAADGRNPRAFQAGTGDVHVTSNWSEGRNKPSCYPPQHQASPPAPRGLANVSREQLCPPVWDWVDLSKESNDVDALQDQQACFWPPSATFEHDGLILDALPSVINHYVPEVGDSSDRDSGDSAFSTYTLDSLSSGSDSALSQYNGLHHPQSESISLVTPIYRAEDACGSTQIFWPAAESSDAPSHSTAGAPPLPSPVLGDALARASSRNLISTDLAQIYHGSLENALKCWLTEEVCPYRGLNRARHPSQYPKLYKIPTYLQRIHHMDHVSLNLSAGRMSAEENSLASKTLSIVIMSFASQWAHSPQQPSSDRSGLRDRDITRIGDFECLLRQSLWHEAQRYVRACARIDCFRAIFAKMVFALVQTPESTLYEKKALACPSSVPSIDNSMDSMTAGSDDTDATECRPDISSAINTATSNSDERPQYLDQALRSLLKWRHRLSKWSSERVAGGPGILYAEDMACRRAALEMQPAFDVLFWFGLMCDTTSSVLNNRPLVISDRESWALGDVRSEQDKGADCGPEASEDQSRYVTRAGSKDAGAVGMWNLTSMQQQHNRPVRRTVERILQQAIPSKVLLWRRLGMLKSIMTYPVEQATVEHHIEAAQEVANFWKGKYGPVIRQCIESHDLLKYRLQSWYVILAAHFHLACLFVADCIEDIDRSRRSCTEQRSLRIASATTLYMTRDSAYTIADLARVCTCSTTAYGESESPGLHSDVHDAIRATALLSEPWTDVLTEALSKAFETMLNWLAFQLSQLPVLDEGSELSWIRASTDSQDLATRCSACVDALELLGRKSHNATLLSRKMRSQLNTLVEPLSPY